MPSASWWIAWPEMPTRFLASCGFGAPGQAQAERVEALATFAQAELALETLAPWDVAYASEQLRKATFSLDAEALRPYFPWIEY